MEISKLIKAFICFLLPCFILVIPDSYWSIELSVVEKRLIAIFLFATLAWILEPIAIYATSLVVILLLLLMISDKSLIFLQNTDKIENFGALLNHKDIMATFASPIILLFLGGFFLAMAATKYRLDTNLARVLLKPFGTNPKYVMLGLMIITAVFSMFMSNTATTAMMLAILAPVLGLFKEGDRGKIAFALAIPVAANIGGIGTPIGTPPNAIALMYLTGEYSISFGKWMIFAIPFVAVLLVIAWQLLDFLFKTKEKELFINIPGRFLKSTDALIVYFVFSLTIILWLLGDIHGMNAYVVALIPVSIFSALGIINKEDLKKINWDVLWLVAGGFALGLALDQTGLAKNLISNIDFSSFSALTILIFSSLLCLLMANFMSHTATANLLLPIIAVVATGIVGLESLGGKQALIIAVAFAASLGMSLPISTPPNALSHATGFIETKDMAKIGASIGIIGLALTFFMIFFLTKINFFIV